MATTTCTSCVTAENFCSKCQIATEILSETDLALDKIAVNDLVTPDLWVDTVKILEKLNAYGKYGPREFPSLPTIENLKDIAGKDNIIFVSLYNNLLNAVQLDAKNTTSKPLTKNGNPLILAEMANNVQKFLKSYNIDLYRCNNCNTAGNCSHNTSCDGEYSSCSDCDDHGECCQYGAPGSTPGPGDGFHCVDCIQPN